MYMGKSMKTQNWNEDVHVENVHPIYPHAYKVTPFSNHPPHIHSSLFVWFLKYGTIGAYSE